jgi:hypothetical protein
MTPAIPRHILPELCPRSAHEHPDARFRFSLDASYTEEDEAVWGKEAPDMPEDQSASGSPRGPKVGKVIRASVLGVHVVEFTYHALARMNNRGITEEDVLSAVRNPTKTGLGAEPGHEHVRWQKDLRTFIDVVYTKKTDRLGIITAWKTKRSPIRPTRRRR